MPDNLWRRRELAVGLEPEVDRGDDPLGALRWSLSKIRRLVDDPGKLRLIADRESVRFDFADASIDVLELRQASRTGPATLSTDRLVALAGMSTEDFLAGYEFPECSQFQAWCLAQREETRIARALVLSALIDQLRSRPEAALPHARALVELRPDNEQDWAELVGLLLAAGHRREAEDHYSLARRTLETAGVVVAGPLLKLARSLQRSAAANMERGRSVRADTIRRAIPSRAAGTLQRPSVAVLPIRSLGEDAALPYLAEAISEDLVSSLSRDRD